MLLSIIQTKLGRGIYALILWRWIPVANSYVSAANPSRVQSVLPRGGKCDHSFSLYSAVESPLLVRTARQWVTRRSPISATAGGASIQQPLYPLVEASLYIGSVMAMNPTRTCSKPRVTSYVTRLNTAAKTRSWSPQMRSYREAGSCMEESRDRPHIM